jgi:hypothetical protein
VAPRPVPFREPPVYLGFLIVHFLPELLHRLFVVLLQGFDGAQDRPITSGPEVAFQLLQGHACLRRQIGYTLGWLSMTLSQ